MSEDNDRFRKINKPADKLAALSHGLNENHVYNSSEIPQQVRGKILLEGFEHWVFYHKTNMKGKLLNLKVTTKRGELVSQRRNIIKRHLEKHYQQKTSSKAKGREDKEEKTRKRRQNNF
ncbi:hypothetical protein RND71_005770 [Anisodus tanguticus]|uniref:Uncharacterized protein n=1 Tax=Anisodus tanguticus TaxID=243964 RepID=A0AAE1ST45_9SOLA|nr:hypothetical protein RND71_005770 [Anisodus tanguticus]